MLEREQHVGAYGALGELDRPRREQDQDASIGEVAGQEIERLPRGAVGQVHVVQNDDDGRRLGKTREEVRNRGELAHQRRCRDGQGRIGCRHARQQRGEILGAGAAELCDRGRFERAEVLLERFDPQAQRRRRAERIGASREADGTVLMAAGELAGKARLAEAAVTEQQNRAQLAGFGACILRLEVGDLRGAPDEVETSRIERSGGRRRRVSRFPSDFVDVDRFAQTLQRSPAERTELHLTATFDEVADEIGREDLTGSGGVAEAACDHDGPAEVVALVSDRLADVQADPHPAVGRRGVDEGGRDCGLNRAGRYDRLDRAGERDHQAVTQRLDRPPTVRSGGVADKAEVRAPQLLGPVVADALHCLCRGHQVGEQDRDH